MKQPEPETVKLAQFTYEETCQECVAYLRKHPDAGFHQIVISYLAGGKRRVCFGLCCLTSVQ